MEHLKISEKELLKAAKSKEFDLLNIAIVLDLIVLEVPIYEKEEVYKHLDVNPTLLLKTLLFLHSIDDFFAVEMGGENFLYFETKLLNEFNELELITMNAINDRLTEINKFHTIVSKFQITEVYETIGEEKGEELMKLPYFCLNINVPKVDHQKAFNINVYPINSVNLSLIKQHLNSFY